MILAKVLFTNVVCTTAFNPQQRSTFRFGLFYRRSRLHVTRTHAQKCRSFFQDFDKTTLHETRLAADHDTPENVLTLDHEKSIKETEYGIMHRVAACQQLFPVSEMDVDAQSMDEKVAWAATPEHPEALQALFATYVASCFMERAWRFALPALVALLYDNLLPVAVVSFVSQVLVFAGGPMVGALMDSMPRVLSFSSLSTLQIVSILISAGMFHHAFSKGIVATPSALALILQPWFVILVIASAIDRLTGLATGVAFERDWVVLLAGPDRSIALANANAMLRRVDLFCEIIGPFLFGIFLSKYRPATCVLIVSVAVIGSLPILVLLVQHTYNLSKGVLDRPKSFNPKDHDLGSSLEAVKQGWIQYLVQPVLPASLAYVLLSFNAVLAPSGLMTTFLTHRGLNPSLIGLYRGLCAVMGFLATFLAAGLIGKVGALKAGALSLTFQALMLALAVLLYLIGPMEQQVSLLFFLILVILSRLGHWGYDMAVAQISQTAIPSLKANLVGTTEMSLASLAELLMLGVAIIANDVSYFGALAALSMAAVAGASCLYWVWLLNPTTKNLLKTRYQ